MRDLYAICLLSLLVVVIPESIKIEFMAAKPEKTLEKLRRARSNFLESLGLGCLGGEYNIIDARGTAFFPSDEGIYVSDPLTHNYNEADLYVFTDDRSGLQACEKDANILFALVYFPDSYVPGVLVLRKSTLIPQSDRDRYNNPEFSE
jgi:hypothetical protein